LLKECFIAGNVRVDDEMIWGCDDVMIWGFEDLTFRLFFFPGRSYYSAEARKGDRREKDRTKRT
jgi:hypothetical protein